MNISTDQKRDDVSASDRDDTERVLEHHLGAFAKGIDSVMSDYERASILITPQRVYSGPQEIRDFFELFMQRATAEFWDAFAVRTKVVEGQIAYIVWDSKPEVALATDTLIVRGGKIVVHTFTSSWSGPC